MSNEELEVVADVYEMGRSICTNLANIILLLKNRKIVEDGDLELLKKQIEFDIKCYMMLATNKLCCEAAEYIRNFIRNYVHDSIDDYERDHMIPILENLQKKFENIINN